MRAARRRAATRRPPAPTTCSTPTRRKLHIANGFTQALNGLHDFATLANDGEGRALFGAGEAELRVELPAFDTGAWSLYSRPGAESDLGYHKVLRDFLRGLCDRLTEDAGPAAARRRGTTHRRRRRPAARRPEASVPRPSPIPTLYCDTAQRFTADLTTKPTLT